MLDKRELLIRVAAILTTLAETNGSPESMLYVAVAGMNITDWQAIRNTMIASGWIKVSAHYVTLTDSGRKIATEINAALAKGDRS